MKIKFFAILLGLLTVALVLGFTYLGYRWHTMQNGHALAETAYFVKWVLRLSLSAMVLLFFGSIIYFLIKCYER